MITDRKVNPSQACTYYIHANADPCPNSPTRMVDDVPMCDECYSDFLDNPAKSEFRDMVDDDDRFVYVDDESGLSDGIL